jgi:hypothetical protein
MKRNAATDTWEAGHGGSYGKPQRQNSVTEVSNYE